MAEKSERFFKVALKILPKEKFINISCASKGVHQKDAGVLDFLMKMNFIISKDEAVLVWILS